MIKKRLVYKIYVCSFWKMQLIIVLNAKCLIMSEDEKHCTSQQTDCFVVFIYDLYTTLISNYSKFILCSYFLEKTTYTYKLSWNILFSNAAVKKNKCNLHCNYNFRKWTAEVYLSLTLCIINIYLGENMYKEQMISTIFANETKQKKSIVDFHLNILLAVNVHICIKYITHNWPSMMFDSTSKKCLLVFDDIMMWCSHMSGQATVEK